MKLELSADAETIPLDRTLAHMRAELEPRAIDVCARASPGAPPPVATVRLSTGGPESVWILADVEDALTNKQIRRKLDLSTTPADARPLMIALGATELVRASWSELALADAPPPTRPIPPEIERVVTESQRAPRPGPARGLLGAAVAAEEFSGGLREVGAELRASFFVTERLQLGARFGPRSGQAESGSNGEVRPDAWLGGLSAGVLLTPRTTRVHASLFGRLNLVRVRFIATPRGEATGQNATGSAVALDGGALAALPLTRTLALIGEVAVGGTLRGVSALDGGEELLGARGIVVSGAAGLGVRF